VTAPHSLRRLTRHSAIYGLGDLVARLLGILLLPLYTAYLSPADYGKIELLVAASAVLLVVLRRGVSEGFFRFYFDSPDASHRRTVIRTTFWFTMTTATVALVLATAFAGPLSHALQLGDEPDLVRAAAVGLWAQMNYTQLTVVLRAEERSFQFVIATLANVLVTIAVTVLLVVVLDQGPLGALVGVFAGTLAVYAVLLVLLRGDLGFELDRSLLRAMNRFGTPLIPAALGLWAISFADRWFIAALEDQAEVGVYSVALRVASAVLLLQLAFRRAWPSFAYSIEDDRDARTAYARVLTYVVLATTWVALGLTLLAPWLVRLLTSEPEFYRAADAVGLLAFSAVAYAGFSVVSIGSGRAKRTQGNWVVAGLGAVVNVALCFALIPPYGMVGAAVATLAAYVVLFLGMVVYAGRVFPVAYEWGRVLSAVAVAAGLAVLGAWASPPLALAVVLAAVFPIALVPIRFYRADELAALRRLVSPKAERSPRHRREG
jgi:O-antigen/teichoic acid export membrane protein